MKEVTVGSWSYFVGHQFHKVWNPCFMGSTRLELSNKNYMFFLSCLSEVLYSKKHENFMLLGNHLEVTLSTTEQCPLLGPF